MKRYADTKKHATPCDLKVGDTVLVKNEKRRKKLAPFYIVEPHIVTSKNGSVITARANDKQITRNTSCFKKALELSYQKEERPTKEDKKLRKVIIINRITAWTTGPDFLFQSEDQWPTNSEKGTIDNDDNVLCEAVNGATDVVRSLPANTSEESKVICPNISEVIDIDRFGNLKKLLRVTASFLRFVNALKKAKQHDKGSRDLQFLSAIVVYERIGLSATECSEIPPQYLTQFGLYTDENHVIRCKGRLNNSSLGLGSRHPILLPSKHRVVELLIREAHEQVKHNGIRDTLTAARERFWAIRGREAVNRIIKDCVVCRKAEGLPNNYGQAPDLPSSRVSDDPPFTNVGLAFAGPLYVQDKKNELDENSNKLKFTFCCPPVRQLERSI
ncbi:Hypothetical predicted protein [Paramuricea clavata]|uniref:Uncharacterized protein n=1 Tax=Paramuricea clavata TaxID=317549 RepID=A0A7D9L8B7_PARCT|nr:Hypothetical predicted protein [Paramuricea clavata]